MSSPEAVGGADVDPHDLAPTNNTKENDDEANDSTLAELHVLREQIISHDALQRQGLQILETAQLRCDAVARAPLLLAELEELRRQIRDACDDICALSVQIVPSPDLEVLRTTAGLRKDEKVSSRTSKLAPLPQDKCSSLRAKVKQTAKKYEDGMEHFEQGWEQLVEQSKAWSDTRRGRLPNFQSPRLVEDPGPSTAEADHRAQVLHNLQSLIPLRDSWLTQVEGKVTDDIFSRLEELLANPKETAARMVSEDPTVWHRLLERPSPGKRTALELLLHLLATVHGVHGVFEFVRSMIEGLAPLIAEAYSGHSTLEAWFLTIFDVVHSCNFTVSNCALDRDASHGLAPSFGLTEPTKELELELLAVLKARKQRSAKARAAKVLSEQGRHSTLSDDSDQSSSLSPRNLSGTIVNTVSSTASQWYNQVASGFSTLQDAAASQIQHFHGADTAEKLDPAPEEGKNKKKPSLYGSTNLPSASSSNSSGLSQFLTPASPTAPRVSAQWSRKQDATVQESKAAAASGVIAARVDAQGRLSHLASQESSSTPLRTRKTSIRVLTNPSKSNGTSLAGVPSVMFDATTREEAKQQAALDDAATQLLTNLTACAEHSAQIPLLIAVFDDMSSRNSDKVNFLKRTQQFFTLHWWAFRHLRRLLCGSYTLSRSSTFQQLSSVQPHTRRQKILQDTWTSAAESLDLHSVHRTIYNAIIQAMRADDPKPPDTSLSQAAKAATRTLCNSQRGQQSYKRMRPPAGDNWCCTTLDYTEIRHLLSVFGLPQERSPLMTKSATVFFSRQGNSGVKISARMNPLVHGKNASPRQVPDSPTTSTTAISRRSRLRSNGARASEQLSMGWNGAPRTFSNWGSPVASPMEFSLAPTVGAGFFDLRKPLSQESGDAPTFRLPKSAQKQLRKSIWAVLSDPNVELTGDIMALIRACASRRRLLDSWNDAASLDWTAQQLASLTVTDRACCIQSTIDQISDDMTQQAEALHAVIDTSRKMLIKAQSRMQAHTTTAQSLLSMMHEDRARIWYASSLRLSEPVRTSWSVFPQVENRDELEDWVKTSGIQDLFLSQDDLALIVALDPGFSAIAGDAATFFEHPCWSREAELARPLFRRSTGKSMESAHKRVPLRAGVVTPGLLRDDQTAPSVLTGLEDFLQKVQMRATGLWLMESMSGVTSKENFWTDADSAESSQTLSRALLQSLELHPSPSLKLKAAHNLQRLAAESIHLRSLAPFKIKSSVISTTKNGVGLNKRPRRETFASQTGSAAGYSGVRPSSTLSNGHPRRALSMYDAEEDLAEGDEGTGQLASLDALLAATVTTPVANGATNGISSTQTIDVGPATEGGADEDSDGAEATPDEILEELESNVASGHSLNETAFNLQLIAAFAPATVLNVQDQGKAFWDLVMALLSLRRDALEKRIKEDKDGSESLPEHVLAFARSEGITTDQ